jgi:hypothetical protein
MQMKNVEGEEKDGDVLVVFCLLFCRVVLFRAGGAKDSKMEK